MPPNPESPAAPEPPKAEDTKGKGKARPATSARPETGTQADKKRTHSETAAGRDDGSDGENAGPTRKRAARQTTQYVAQGSAVDLAVDRYFKLAAPSIHDMVFLQPLQFPPGNKPKEKNQYHALGHPRNYSYRNPLTVAGFQAPKWHDPD